MSLDHAIANILNSRLNNKISPEEIDNIIAELREEIHSHILVVCPKTRTRKWIAILDILYIDREQGISQIYTSDLNIYEHFLTFEIIQSMVEEFNFEISDSKILVNTQQVKYFNTLKGRIYFTNEMSEKTKHDFTFLSKRRVANFKKALGKDKDIVVINKKLKYRMVSDRLGGLFI